MPYILLDNAVKYSLTCGEITVTLVEDSSNVCITVHSLGPRLETSELSLLCTVGFRGKYAKEHSEIGTGQGLALLKTICDSHAATLDISSVSYGTTVGGIPYGSFTVDISIPKN